MGLLYCYKELNGKLGYTSSTAKTGSFMPHFSVRAMEHKRIFGLIIWAVLVTGTLGACRPGSPASTESLTTIALAVGESAVLDDGELTLTFREVRNDSRCSEDVSCIVAGEATVILGAVLPSGRGEDLTFEVPPKGTASTDYESYRITILELEPQNRSDREIAPDEYSVRIQVDCL